MNSVLLQMIIKGLTSQQAVELFLSLAEHYVQQTDNTLDDKILEVLKKCFLPQP